jgi:hypothetical protein
MILAWDCGVKKRQEFRHALRLSKGKPKVTVMNKIAPVVFHGIYYDVELFRNVADDGFWDSVFVLFNFGHKFSLSANNLPADSVFFVRNTAQRVKELPLPFILTRFFQLSGLKFLCKIFFERM